MQFRPCLEERADDERAASLRIGVGKRVGASDGDEEEERRVGASDGDEEGPRVGASDEEGRRVGATDDAPTDIIFMQ